VGMVAWMRMTLDTAIIETQVEENTCNAEYFCQIVQIQFNLSPFCHCWWANRKGTWPSDSITFPKKFMPVNE